MGYDLCRFDDNSVDEELICCICREVLQDPVQVRCGGVWRGGGGVEEVWCGGGVEEVWRRCGGGVVWMRCGGGVVWRGVDDVWMMCG